MWPATDPAELEKRLLRPLTLLGGARTILEGVVIGICASGTGAGIALLLICLR